MQIKRKKIKSKHIDLLQPTLDKVTGTTKRSHTGGSWEIKLESGRGFLQLEAAERAGLGGIPASHLDPAWRRAAVHVWQAMSIRPFLSQHSQVPRWMEAYTWDRCNIRTMIHILLPQSRSWKTERLCVKAPCYRGTFMILGCRASGSGLV